MELMKEINIDQIAVQTVTGGVDGNHASRTFIELPIGILGTHRCGVGAQLFELLAGQHAVEDADIVNLSVEIRTDFQRWCRPIEVGRERF